MKRNARLWWISFIVCTCLCVFVGLLFTGCVSRSEPIVPVVEPEEFGTIPVKMRPQEEVEFAGGELAMSSVSSALVLPSALQSMLPPSKAVSFNEADLTKVGSGFDPLLPLNNVEGVGEIARFSPTWEDGQETINDVAFCTFSFPLAAFAASDEEQTLGLGWDTIQFPEDNMDLFVGFGNIAEDAWDWFQGPEDGVITIESYAPYEGPAGDVLIIIALLNNRQCLLTQLEVGDLEFRGLGASTPILFANLQLLPQFWQIVAPVDSVDLSPDCSPINDQGGTQACTAFAIGDGALNYHLGQKYGDFGWDFTDPNNLVSPRYIYVQTGEDMGLNCPNQGRNSWDIVEWVINNGASTELNTPFGNSSAALFNCTPDWTAEALADAALLNISTRTFIGTWNAGTERYYLTDDNINDVKTILREQRRVVGFRTQVDFHFSDPDYANNETWTYDGVNRGGHAMLIVGYNDNYGTTGAFKVRNSWGVNWGDNGYCWISYESFKSQTAGAYAYYISVNCDPAIVSRFCDDAPLVFAPCGLRIPVLYPDRIIFDWEPVMGAQRYQIFRDIQGEPIGSVEAPTGPEAPMFTDMQVEDSFAHVYWVRAVSDQDYSGYSDPLVGYLSTAMP